MDEALDRRDEQERQDRSSRMDQLIGDEGGRRVTSDTGAFIYRDYGKVQDSAGGDEFEDEAEDEHVYKEEEVNLEAFDVPLRYIGGRITCFRHCLVLCCLIYDIFYCTTMFFDCADIL